MRLSALIEGYEFLSVSGRDPEITALCCETDRVTEGALYFCLPGTRTDGHSFAVEAVENGAAALVVERILPIAVPQVLVKKSRKAMSALASAFYGHPSRDMITVGITGTNGKTTTSFIIRGILDEAGYKTGVIGTTAIYIGTGKRAASLTTPDPIDLHAALAEMRDAGIDAVVMEVSAHALFFGKTDGIFFDCAVFTNLSQDHLDFFGDMECYKRAKKLFFRPQSARCAIVNIDDPCGREIAAECAIPCVTFGAQNPADVFSVNYKSGVRGLEYILNAFDDVARIRFKLPGLFNMYNTLCAAAVAARLEVGVKAIAAGIASLERVPGRFNVIHGGEFDVVVDFAHTPDGLENILRCITDIAAGRIITVFGCGGNRDAAKRSEMGRIAARYSDYTIITSDNPRFETPSDIIEQIAIGAASEGGRFVKIESRPAAIAHALRIAGRGDIILVAGKGDERYQDIMGQKIPYYDNNEVEKQINMRGIKN